MVSVMCVTHNLKDEKVGLVSSIMVKNNLNTIVMICIICANKWIITCYL